MPDEERVQLARKAQAASVRANARRRHEKWAAEMRDYGWDCTPPAVENTPTTTTESETP